jgi:MFS family permease
MPADRPTSAARGEPWLASATALLGAGWGSNQFTPMLLLYGTSLGLGTGTAEALFGFYALGLAPGLLLAGPLSDARGRRPVVLASACLSLLASLILIAGSASIPILFAGRLLAGLGSGAALGAGTAWLRELSAPPFGDAKGDSAARRAAVAMTLGFALGPIVAGLLAQWGPDPLVVPYLPHLAIMVVVLLAVWRAPETVEPRGRVVSRPFGAGIGDRRFRWVVVPMAPWVFVAPAVAFALLPSIVGAGTATDGIALTATITMLCALAGVMIQPLARRAEGGDSRGRAGEAGLLLLALGLGLGALSVAEAELWLLVPTAIVLGGAYGLCLVAGLVEVQRLADPRALASLTAIFYAFTYLGFAAPFLFALAAHLVGYSVQLLIAASLAILTGALVRQQGLRT